MSAPSSQEFQELYRRYGPAVRLRCRAICGNTEDADEALQETFLKAWRARHRFDGRHPLAWLQVIGRNASLELLRRKRPWRSDPHLWLNTPDPGLVSQAVRLEACRLLDNFNSEDAAILRLRYAEDWRIHEIAEHMGSSQRTIRRRLMRLETRARALLGAKEVA